MIGEGSQNGVSDCAPCADSEMSLKERIAKLDDMKLVTGKESDDDKSDDEESLV